MNGRTWDKLTGCEGHITCLVCYETPILYSVIACGTWHINSTKPANSIHGGSDFKDIRYKYTNIFS